jgi:hypothetical protein
VSARKACQHPPACQHPTGPAPGSRCLHAHAPSFALQLSGSCGALRKLYLRGCHAVCDNVCRQLPSVEELDLAFTSVTGADPGTCTCSTNCKVFSAAYLFCWNTMC